VSKEGGGGSCVDGLLLGLNRCRLLLITACFMVLILLPGFSHGTSPCSMDSVMCAIIQPFIVFTAWNFKIHLHKLRRSDAKQCQGASLIGKQIHM